MKQIYGDKNPNWRGGVTFNTCRLCGTSFRGNGKSQCCSRKCANKLQEKEKIEKTCLTCGSIFLVTPFWKDKRKFCSYKCAYGNRDRDKQAKIIINCVVCNKTIETTIYRSKTKKYCSRKCQGIVTSKQAIERWKNPEFRKREIDTRHRKHFEQCMLKDFQGGMHAHTYRRIVFDQIEKKCVKCGETDISKLMVHHKDENRKNNKLDNLQVLCRTCHRRHHVALAKILNTVKLDNYM
jgi:hypothetical protein